MIKTNYDTVIGGYSPIRWEHFGNGPWSCASASKQNFLFTFVQNEFKECKQRWGNLKSGGHWFLSFWRGLSIYNDRNLEDVAGVWEDAGIFDWP